MGTESYSYIKNHIQAAHYRLARARKEAAESKVQPARWQRFYSNPWVRSGGLYWESMYAEKPKPFGDSLYVYTSTKLNVGQVRDTGFRFVGWSDELVGGIDHTGWYMDDENGDFNGTVRGFVLQMPARDGKPRYFPAIYQSENDEVVMWPLECDDEIKTVARWADRYAERWAEDSREWYQKDRAERRIEELKEMIDDERKDIRDYRMKRRSVIASRRMLRAFRPNSIAIKTLSDMIRGFKDDARKAFNNIEKMQKEIDNAR